MSTWHLVEKGSVFRNLLYSYENNDFKSSFTFLLQYLIWWEEGCYINEVYLFDKNKCIPLF
jgi:hypothetical protein